MKRTLFTPASPTYPVRAVMWHDEARIITGNSFSITMSNNQPYQFDAQQSPSGDGDTFENDFEISAGTYTLSILGSKYSNRAKVDWYLDGVLIESGQDWYASSTISGHVEVITGLEIVQGGNHSLRGVVNGRNASSTGYICALTKYWLMSE